jgi:hypothetical protein
MEPRKGAWIDMQRREKKKKKKKKKKIKKCRNMDDG